MIENIKKNNAFFRQMLFLAVLILMGAVMLRQLSFFIGSFLGAITFYIILRKVMLRMVERHRWPAWLAALVLVLAICVVLLGLGYFVFDLLAGEIATVDTSQMLETFQGIIPTVNEFVGFDLLSPELLRESTAVLTKMAQTIVNTTYSFAANIFMTLLLLYFMLAHARTLEEKAAKYVPFGGESRKLLMEEVTSIIYSNGIGIPAMMLAQGLVAALVYWIFGLHNLMFWAFMTALCGLIPMIGTVIVSVPLGVWFIADGFVGKGVLLILCGVLVIANVDNLLRIILNKKFSNTHPLIVIFGVILGIPLFGFWGIIFGPLMISVFLLLVRIYYKEYKLNN